MPETLPGDDLIAQHREPARLMEMAVACLEGGDLTRGQELYREAMHAKETLLPPRTPVHAALYADADFHMGRYQRALHALVRQHDEARRSYRAAQLAIWMSALPH